MACLVVGHALGGEHVRDGGIFAAAGFALHEIAYSSPVRSAVLLRGSA